MSVTDDLILLLAQRGGAMYGNESVTQLAHAVQCATLAEAAGASPATISAALLHDIGHLVLEDDAEAADDGIDLQHEKAGADHLARWFGDDVLQPVRLHVDAKRYLCATQPGYFATLSPASVTSLGVQGGPFDAREAEYFASQPFAMEAVKLRRWDDAAKDPEVITPSVQHFQPYLDASLRA
ncbi:phosphonate degradation HD-domain oxygenase [Minwuia sp.]|uniref:phosphonate degradation HD-domain oxygenase n=1 Tax=Minwuia sp. TaxID=2493630 RepID=UPI003A8DF1CE